MAEPESSCWECEIRTNELIVVSFHTSAGEVARFPLCPACYHAYFVPLAGAGATVLMLRRQDDRGERAP